MEVLRHRTRRALEIGALVSARHEIALACGRHFHRKPRQAVEHRLRHPGETQRVRGDAAHRSLAQFVVLVTHARLPAPLRLLPVIGDDHGPAQDARLALGAFDQRHLAALDAGEREERRAGERRPRDKDDRLLEGFAVVEGVAQQMVRRPVALARQRVAEIERRIDRKAQPAACAAQHRRLIDDGAETARRHGGEHADRSGPGDVVIVAGGAFLPGDFDSLPEALERPVERAADAGPAVRILIGLRGAGEEIGHVQGHRAGEAENLGHMLQFGAIGRGRAPQPVPGDPVDWRKAESANRLDHAETGLAQRRSRVDPRLRMSDRSAVAHVEERNRVHRRPSVRKASLNR